MSELNMGQMAPVQSLSRPQINIVDMRIWEPASLQFSKGGCDRPACVVKAEIVDVPRGLLALLPMTLTYAKNIHNQLGAILAEINTDRKG